MRRIILEEKMVERTESLGGIRLNGTPVWKCSICGKKYQTKKQAHAHEAHHG